MSKSMEDNSKTNGRPDVNYSDKWDRRLGCTMANAIFGIVGIVLGKILSGGTQLWIANRRDAEERRRAQRSSDTEVMLACRLLADSLRALRG